MSKSSPSSIKSDSMSEKDAEQSALWINEIFSENPELLSLRERVLPWTGGSSFAQVVHTNTISTNSSVNRLTLLELIYQHLISIGMYQTAEILKKECGHTLQKSDQPWDRTDLHLLASMGVLYQENAWEIPNDPEISFTHECIEEDYYASPYHEDCSTIWQELYDPDLNVTWIPDKSGQKCNLNSMHLASLRRLVVFMVTSEANALPDKDLHKFLLIMPSITSSRHFFQHLMAIFDLQNLNIPDHHIREKLLSNIDYFRIKILTIIKKWLYFLGLFIGRETISSISDLCRRLIENHKTYNNKTVQELAQSIMELIPSLEYGTKKEKDIPKPPDPIIKNYNVIFRPFLTIVGPESIEVARQISLVFHSMFKSIPSREFVVALGKHIISQLTPALIEFFKIGKKLKYLVLETLAERMSEETLKKLIEIVRELIKFANFEGAFRICQALDNKKLKQVRYMQEFLYNENSPYHKEFLSLKANCERSEEYHQLVTSFYNSGNPGIPNIQVELCSLSTEDSLSYIDGKINIAKKRSLADKTNMLYRFQNKSYNFYDVPQIQKVIQRGSKLTKNKIYAKIASLA